MVRELRTCPVTGRIVLLNQTWPDPLPQVPTVPAPCWFCEPGRGPVLARVGVWRAVPHPVPALGIEGDVRVRAEGGRVRRDAVGAHELLFTEQHPARPKAAIHADASRLLISRVHDLRRDTRLRSFRMIHRAAPGLHPVWQLFALPFDLATTAPAAWRDGELRDRERVVAETETVVVIAAWAPRQPFELWVLPRRGRKRLEELDISELFTEAALWAERTSDALRGAAVDWVVEDGEPVRIELIPRVSPPSAVEVGAGLPLHGVRPEEAATFLRSRLAT